MKRKGKLAVLMMIALCLLVLAGCMGGNGRQGKSEPAASTGNTSAAQEANQATAEANEGSKLSDTPITFTWLVADRREAPVRNDWPVFEEIFKKTNVKVRFEPVPDGIDEKIRIMIATNSVTDFMAVSANDARVYGPQGVFLNLANYLDMMPNLVQYFDRYPEAKALATGDDGGIYAVAANEGNDFGSSWIVRQDIMDELGLSAPNNPEEFYLMLKKMKEAYPESYPLISRLPIYRDGGEIFGVLIRSFTGLNGALIPFDPETEKYVFTPDHPGFKDALIYLNKLHDEKLLDPEFGIMTQAQWEERFLAGKSFVTHYDKARVEGFENIAKESNLIPGFTTNSIPPFAVEGVKNYLFSRVEISNATTFAISNKVSDKEAAVKFMDYLLSKEGSDYLALGIEGETYSYIDGEPKFLESLGSAPYNFLRGEYGIWYPSVNLDNGKSRQAEFYSEKKKGLQAMYEPYVVIAPKSLILTDEENELQKNKLDNLTQYMTQKISEFIAGRQPINDATMQEFVQQSIKLGAHELRDMYNVSHERTYGTN